MPFDSLRQDARSAFRSVRHRPAATAAAIGMLALAIGITAAMFTLVDALILRPLPFPDSGQLAILRMARKNGGSSLTQPAVLAAWRESRAFAAVEGARSAEALVST